METKATSTPQGDESLDAFSQIKMISPMEMDLAFVRAAFFDLSDPLKMEEWRTRFLTFVSAIYHFPKECPRKDKVPKRNK